MGRVSQLLGHWHRALGVPDPRDAAPAAPRGEAPCDAPAASRAGAPDADPPFATHLHGRDLIVVHEADPPHWHWRVSSPHGAVLAEGDAPTRDDAEHAAEDEATAVHPPTDELLDRLLS
jgi:hypothetical protein